MSEFSKFVKLGNMVPCYPKSLGDLSRLIYEAWYHKRWFSLEEPEAQQYNMTVESSQKRLEGQSSDEDPGDCSCIGY